MCECKEDIERRVLEKFKHEHPDATGHEAEMGGYAIVFGKGGGLRPAARIDLTAKGLTKTGKDKAIRSKVSMLATYCPYCGEKFVKD